MLSLLSPAKSLDYDTPWEGLPHTQAQFIPQSAELVRLLRTQKASDLSELMNISPALADLNVARYKAWSKTFTTRNAKPAVLAFNGDVYDGLDAKSLSLQQLQWAQEHVAILSGLYGVLRPLDLMQPYRLEMGTALTNPKGANLYRFWGAGIAQHLDQRLSTEANPVIVNLASQEYFKSVDRKVLKAHVIECVFEEERAGQYKVISFMAKRARGLMARYIIVKKIKSPAGLQKFNAEGYAFAPAVSTPERLVFRRATT
jgi:cytoplasmic iron level regulating protein YaaA (DUF328/UPF0246 family)